MNWSVDSGVITVDSGVATADGSTGGTPPGGWTADTANAADSPYALADGTILNPTAPGFRVQAVATGFYQEIFRNIGDVFDLAIAGDFSDSTVSMVPPGNPDFPLYGWMLAVPSNTALVMQALSGNSSPVTGTYGVNAAGVKNLSIPRYVA